VTDRIIAGIEQIREGRECSRIEAFSDGVFAIAITLLVLDLIQVPAGAVGENLLGVYLHHWPRFLSFFIGFLTILVCWINHHHMFLYIRRFDSRLMWLNGFLLFLVTFAPFPTAILAQYVTTGGRGAVATFGFGYFLMACAYNFLWSYAFSHDLLIKDGDREFFLAVRTTYRYASAYNFVAFFVCFLSIPLAIVMYLVMFSVFAFPKEFAARLARKTSARRHGQRATQEN
jgi:uncharacterized membrane protein